MSVLGGIEVCQRTLDRCHPPLTTRTARERSGLDIVGLDAGPADCILKSPSIHEVLISTVRVG